MKSANSKYVTPAFLCCALILTGCFSKENKAQTKASAAEEAAATIMMPFASDAAGASFTNKSFVAASYKLPSSASFGDEDSADASVTFRTLSNQYFGVVTSSCPDFDPALPVFRNASFSCFDSLIFDLAANFWKTTPAYLFSLQEFAAIQDYKGQGYRTMNAALRNTEDPIPPLVSASIKGTASTLNKLPRRSFKKVYRGAGFSDQFVQEHFVAGQIFYDRAFLSTSASQNGCFYSNVRLEISIPDGVEVSGAYIETIFSGLSEGHGEDEFLFQPLSKFKVLSTTVVPVNSTPPSASPSPAPSPLSGASSCSVAAHQKFANDIEFISLENPTIASGTPAVAMAFEDGTPAPYPTSSPSATSTLTSTGTAYPVNYSTSKYLVQLEYVP